MPESLQSTSPETLPEQEPASRASTIAQTVLGIAALACFIYFFPQGAKTTAIFLVVLGVLVFVHELGHFQFARWAGMKVNRFALGFPPFIYTKHKDGIDYSIGALPIGGMVDIAGLGSEEEMVAESRQNVEGLLEKTNIGARTDHETARREVYRDPSRPFGQKQFQDGNLFWRFMVLFGGPLMNFALAIIVFIGVYTVAGYPVANYKAQIDTVMAQGPAEKAGLQSGDEVVSIGGKKISTNGELSDAIRGGKAQPTKLTVLRSGKTFDVPITPVIKDIEGNGVKVPSIGIAYDLNAIRNFNYIRLTPMGAVEQGFAQSIGVSLSILDTIKRALSRNLSSQEVKGIGGPVMIAKTVGQASSFGPAVLLNFAGMLSVNLGLMNLLPLPALDGGRIMFLGYELVARRPFNPRWEGLVHAAGMLMLLCFMLFITLRDVNAIALLHHLIKK